MFKKLKDKLAEEVKSSPQRIQQFAQAAQAAVTSASSSISDITNSDLFSIGDNDNQIGRQNPRSSNSQQNTFQDISLVQPTLETESMDHATNHIIENQRQRRLSNSSFASDVSFRLPSYESPSMYHLQSDMEISASEAEERGFSSGTVSLDRVTKEQLYAAYRRTQERYAKYRTQYADLARHYKLLERENAKARSVLVETQDKALRRISELKEQCTLEQSAKAHLEKALRMDIEERNMKIDTLNTKIKLLYGDKDADNLDKVENAEKNINETITDTQLIDLSGGNENKVTYEELAPEVTTLNNKIEKLEQLVNKYKESLKTCKDRNSQLTTELQIFSKDSENKSKEIEQLKTTGAYLEEAKQKIHDLKEANEELQNKINAYDFNKTKETSTLEVDLQKAQEEITQLRTKIEVFTKREEEYAISLAENKLSIHKELESKEAEIKSLKENLSSTKKEIQSLNIVINDYKNSISMLEDERSKLNNNVSELNIAKTKITEMSSQIKDLTQKCQSLEHFKTKADEEYKCLQLQVKQETAEKLAMVDRNSYLENRNSQLCEENGRKSSHISQLEHEMQNIKKNIENTIAIKSEEDMEKKEMLDELNNWKIKYNNLESEIQEEREELVKLQSEIEKLLANHELIQNENSNLHASVLNLKSENTELKLKASCANKITNDMQALASKARDLQIITRVTSEELKSLRENNNKDVDNIKEVINTSLLKFVEYVDNLKDRYEDIMKKYNDLQKEFNTIREMNEKTLNDIKSSQKKNEELRCQISTIEKENTLLNETMKGMSKEHEGVLNELNYVKDENRRLETKADKYENKYQHLELQTKHNEEQHSIVTDKLTVVQSETEDILKKINDLENLNIALNAEKDKITNELNVTMESFNALVKENEKLNSVIKDFDCKKLYISELEQTITIITQENMLLKTQSEKITKNVKELDAEIKDVRNSHAEIEVEKNRLNAMLEILESKEDEKKIVTLQNTTYVQTDDNWQQELNLVHEENNALKENYSKIEMDLKDENVTLQNNITSLLAKNNALEKDIENIKEINNKLSKKSVEEEENIIKFNEVLENHNILKNTNDTLQEENRRLKSDIEGLQTYLTKISKENSTLNDKLRELIATSENTSDKAENVCDLADLKSEIQKEKEKHDDLLRENTLLIEENLELKDQLQSQNYPRSAYLGNHENNQEHVLLKEKYDNLLNSKNILDKRITELELTDKSVNGNMQQMQESNERLRQNNEKLERRLDEALVSLRHLHSLTENTELEYLRNILYEYLTGSGTHSITLAKVLSAVVKFDERQTQLVLQKEKERQGLLRQLGLI